MKHFTKVFCFIILCLPLKGFTEVDKVLSNLTLDTNASIKVSLHSNYDDSVTSAEYQFFMDTTSIKYTHLVRKASFQLKDGRTKEAANTIARIPVYAIPNEALPNYYKISILSDYLNNETENALSVLKSYEFHDSLKMAEDTAVQLLKCLILLEQDNYSQLSTCFNLFDSKFRVQERQSLEIDSLIQVGLKLHLKSAKKASLLSALIPGTGQMYTGHFEEGLVNLGLNVLTLSFTGYCIYKGYYATGILIGYTLFQRFYTGGLRRTEKLTSDYNNAKTIPLKQNLKDHFIRLNLHTK